MFLSCVEVHLWITRGEVSSEVQIFLNCHFARSSIISCAICLVFSRDECLKVESWGDRVQSLARRRLKGWSGTPPRKRASESQLRYLSNGDLMVRGILWPGNKDLGKGWEGATFVSVPCLINDYQWLFAVSNAADKEKGLGAGITYVVCLDARH